MQKTLLYNTASNNGWKEDWFYLVLDEETGEMYAEHSWDHWNPAGSKKDSKKMNLAQLKQASHSAYEKAVEIIAANFPERMNELD